MFKIIALVLVVTVAAFLVYVATKPTAFRIERTHSITASPEVIFPFINDLHRFNSWNPFAQMDPTLKITYSGPDSGQGAAYTWVGTGKAGAGRMEIAESSPSSRVSMRLTFTKPFTANNMAEFTITADGPTSRVTWAMTGRNTYVQNAMGTLFNMDKMVGSEFDQGLANLAALAQQQR